MSGTMGVLSRVRRPEYTGENRCLPCTVVNAVIAGFAGLVVGVGASAVTTPTVGLVAGGVVLAVGAASIYLRGYLVPGTPTLTKRYFPEWLLGWFGKAPEPTQYDGEGDLDPEAVLVGLGALEEDETGADLRLTDSFRTAWYEAIDAADGDDQSRRRFLDLMDVDVEAVEFEEYGDAFQAYADDVRLGTWESAAAFRADLGAATVLADRWGEWDERPVHQRDQLLGGLRLFIDRCPACGAVPRFGTETVESCCSTHEVAAVECEDCGARLFETRT